MSVLYMVGLICSLLAFSVHAPAGSGAWAVADASCAFLNGVCFVSELKKEARQ